MTNKQIVEALNAKGGFAYGNYWATRARVRGAEVQIKMRCGNKNDWYTVAKDTALALAGAAVWCVTLYLGVTAV